MHTYRGSFLQLTVSTLVLAAVLRTWLVMGLIEPVMVSGSSMAPALRGLYLSVTCEQCGNRFDVGAEFLSDQIGCPRCGFRKNSTEELPLRGGDRLFIDRTAFQFRSPRRWEPVVFRSPEDGQLTVKRVVGLPGESLQLINGDVWIDGQVARKTLGEMRALRQMVHVETAEGHRWHGEPNNAWRWHDNAWQVPTKDGNWHWLRYEHPNAEPITSDSVYNAGLTQRLFPVRDLALSAKVRATGVGRISIRFENGIDRIDWQSNLPNEAFLEIFAVDRHWRVFIDGKLAARKGLPVKGRHAGSHSPFAIGVQGDYVEIRDLRLYRDIHYSSQSEELGVKTPMALRNLRSNEIFVVGDNVPVSIDSRHWGPVPLQLVVGKPLGVR